VNKNFLKNNFISLTGAFLGGLLGYLFHFVVSRQLTVAQYGELQAVSSLAAFFGVFSAALSFFIVKYSSVLALHNDRKGQVHFLELIAKKFRMPVFGIIVVFAAIAPFLKKFLHLSDYFGLFSIGLSVILGIYFSFYLNVLQGWKNFFALAAVGTATAAAKFFSGWAFAAFIPSASFAAFSFLVSAAAGLFLAKAYFRRQWPPPREKEENENNWRENYFSGESFRKSFFQIFFFSLALAAVGNLDIIAVKNVASAETAGYYAALGVLGKILLWFNLAVVATLLPDAFSSGHTKKPVESRLVLSSYALIFCLSVPSIFFFRFFSDFPVRLLFGGKYVAVSRELWLFGLMAAVLSCFLLEAKLSMARKDFRATWLLGISAVLLASLVFWRHDTLREIASLVTLSFFIGWISVFFFNLRHRFALDSRDKKELRS